MNITSTELVALSIFSSYFLVILGLFAIIGKNIPVFSGAGRIWQRRVFSGLVVASLLHTWYYMLAFLKWSFTRHRDTSGSESGPFVQQITSWLLNTGLFEEAWAIVSTDPVPWWLSEPICLFTVGAWTVFLATNGRKYAVKHIWAYMLLGQLVAISVATNLFFLALLLSPTPKPRPSLRTSHAPPILWTSVLISMLAVGISPHTTAQTFLPNLLIMHFLIVLPLLPFGHNTNSKFAIRTKTLYSLTAVIALGLRARTTLVAFASLPPAQQSLTEFLYVSWRTIHAHPAQSSIGWDVIWTSVSLIIWVAISPLNETQRSWSSTASAFVTSVLFSAGVGAPLAFKQQVEEDGGISDKNE
ncbi:hypothetical protein BXZ70DRAFT_677673 [Cristinia sonorae]|uniref:Uncharacterized protein n=1 Tax=Cristinia sonorae TaxID=1940300 RepID=A0A8K0UTU4_9AGAR|nr:hypothetical protein BXZ70DRAFT_677673 [Cristinia sonorae]